VDFHAEGGDKDVTNSVHFLNSVNSKNSGCCSVACVCVTLFTFAFFFEVLGFELKDSCWQGQHTAL
jgi:hypothetical protein